MAPLLGAKCRPTTKYVTLALLSVFTWVPASYVYFSSGGRPGISWNALPTAMTKTLPVNKYQNGGHLLNVTGTRNDATSSQAKRIAMLKEYCGKNPTHSTLWGYSSQSYLERERIMVVDRIKTMYCFIPKTGCTTLKYLMYNLEHGTNESRSNHGLMWIHERRYRWLKDYSKEEADMRLATYNKLIVVRDPLERLASAWLDKFNHDPRHVSFIKAFQRKTRMKNLTKTHTKQDRNSQDSVGGKPSLPFRDFIWGIANEFEVHKNIHWEPFFSLCAPCQVEYDFIAHTDTLVEDLRLFLHKIGVVGKDYLLPTQRPSRAKTNFGTTFREVPTEDLRRIGEVYKPDFDAFGYNFEEDLALIEDLRRDALKQNGSVQ
ncbi:carbohydrate sulfotransferase 10-like isoform X2 [Branchiostoma floridae x Branchiostoma japonicum]